MPNEKIRNEKSGSEKNQIKEEIERKILQAQILQANLQIIHDREQALSQRLQELSAARQAIEELESVKDGSMVMMPLGSGNFVSGKISDTGKILVGVGGGIAVKKSPEEALKILDKRIAETDSVLRELEKQYTQIETEIHRLQSEMQKISGK